MIHGTHPSARFKTQGMAKLPKPARIHPAAQPRIRLPQGMENTSEAAPPPFLPGVGKI